MGKPPDRLNRTDAPPTGSADSLPARLEALPPNHPSSPRFQGNDTTRQPGGDRADGAAVTVRELVRRSAEPDHGRMPDAASGPKETAREAAHRPREGDLTPLDDAAYEEHVRMVEERLDAAEHAGMSSEMLYTIDPDHKIWSKDRLAQRGRLTEDMYHASDDVPADGRAVVAGGIAGAGKTTVLESFAGIDRSQYLTVNPDKIKEKMAERRMIPDVDGLSPMERSGLVHEESSQAASDLARRAYGDRRNVIWDITMSRMESTLKRIDNLRESSYTEIVGVFVDIPPKKSVERATSRHRHGLEEYRNGRGHGGRHLAPDLIWRQQTDDGQTLNRKVFESLKPCFDRWMIFDNSVDGRDPVLVEAGGREREKA